jgi:hypothetical protein
MENLLVNRPPSGGHTCRQHAICDCHRLFCAKRHAHDRISTADDPFAISDQALLHAFDREVAEHEIQTALCRGRYRSRAKA